MKGTNTRIEAQNRKKQSHTELTDAVEIKALIGLWFKLGINGFAHVPVHEIWSTDKSKLSIGKRPLVDSSH